MRRFPAPPRTAGGFFALGALAVLGALAGLGAFGGLGASGAAPPSAAARLPAFGAPEALAALAPRAGRCPFLAARSAAFCCPSGEATYSRRSAMSSATRSGVRSAGSSPRFSEALV